MENEKFHSIRTLCFIGAAAIIAASSGAFAQTAMEKKHSTMPGMAASGDMHASMMGMMKNMESMKPTGDIEDFAMMMKAHHQGAIDMAQLELKKGKDEKLHKMARKIIDAQRKEIKQLDEWLAKHK
jgi:uncharacterized protein (DUF305 family)